MSTVANSGYEALKHMALAAREDDQHRYLLGQQSDAILQLIAEHEALTHQGAPTTPTAPPEEEVTAARRVPTVFPMSPAAQRHRREIRELIDSCGLSLETRPDGLIHISGYDVDLLVRDLMNVTPTDISRAR